ncbi:unnamed protein product [Haemonchus placei]|uniref:C2 tensin-type domain-containing protein n=1 Tax=Haemonchus placei TaxID=6290 RepID=A0A0N4WCH1_HAEPC|nr:unnamed protein product [Haemonchus placei]
MIVNQCSERRYLRIRGYSNRDEIKVHVMPSKEVLSLGVGRDIQVEVSMKEDMPNCSFFGADPVKEPNQDMFETVGVFYHIAVGGKNGTSLATVLEPDSKPFFFKHNRFSKCLFNNDFKLYIDQLMIDIEWEEYDVLPFLVKSGDLENSDVVLCQVRAFLFSPTSFY